MIVLIRRCFSLLVIVLLTSCFGIDQRGGILKYRSRIVHTGFGRFSVGDLPPSWTGPRIRLKQLVFENDRIGGTIVTDALCGPKYNDSPLLRLAQDLFLPLGNRHLNRERSLTLAGREALRLQGTGTMDGVPIGMDVVVLKKDFCLYDFVYFAPVRSFSEGEKDFEKYFREFRVH